MHGSHRMVDIDTVMPFAKLGLGWVCPTLVGAAIGLILHFARGKKAA